MKNLKKIIAIIGVLLLSFSSQTAIAQNNVEKAPIGVLIKIHVNFSSVAEKTNLEQELPKRRGIFSAEAILQTQEVTIDYDPAATDKKHIIEAIKQMGYSTESSTKQSPNSLSH